jgi:hypothetical protein
MAIDSVRRSQLLKQIKRGRSWGAIQLTRLFVILVAAIELLGVNEAVFRQGKGSFGLLATSIVMVFLVAIAAIGLGQLEMNERFTALLEAIEEDE